jgi:hypothetical protein
MGVTLKELRRKKPITIEHLIPADDDQNRRLKEAEQQLGIVMFTGDEDQVARARAALEEAKAEVRRDGITMVFQCVGRKRYQEILEEHPPTAAQLARADEEKRERPVMDPDTFWPVLLSETVVGSLTPEQWQAEVLDSKDWGAGEVAQLRDLATAVNTSTRVGELGN